MIQAIRSLHGRIHAEKTNGVNTKRIDMSARNSAAALALQNWFPQGERTPQSWAAVPLALDIDCLEYWLQTYLHLHAFDVRGNFPWRRREICAVWARGRVDRGTPIGPPFQKKRQKSDGKDTK